MATCLPFVFVRFGIRKSQDQHIDFEFLKNTSLLPKKLRRIISTSNIKNHFLFLFDKYLKLNSRFELNISFEEQRGYQRFFKGNSTISIGSSQDSLAVDIAWHVPEAYEKFNQLQISVINVLMDSYTR